MLFNSKEEKQPDKVDDILKMADEFAHTNSDIIYCCEEKIFYLWKDEYFQRIMDIQCEKYLLEYKENFAYFTINGLRSFMHRVATITQRCLDEFNRHDAIDLNNGMLEIATGELKPHDKKYLSTVRIPYDYDATKGCDAWLGFLNSSLEGDQERIRVLQEYMGYCLGRDNSFHKALIMVGDGRNGKGTTMHIISRLVGLANVSALKLGEMNNKETVSNLVGKLVNIDADTDASAEGYESDFRRITAGDQITARKLYKDAFTFTPYVKMVIGANDLPRIADKTHGFYDRLIIIPYNVSFAGREDFGLKGKLEAEISGILNWALEGRRRLYKNGGFSITKTMIDYVYELKIENNPVEAFVHECVGIHDDALTIKQDMYLKYCEWCKDNGHRSLSKIKFGKELFRVCGSKTEKNYRISDFMTHDHAWPRLYIKGKWSPVESKVWDE
jgi:putative DNA primase/helicase